MQLWASPAPVQYIRGFPSEVAKRLGYITLCKCLYPVLSLTRQTMYVYTYVILGSVRVNKLPLKSKTYYMFWVFVCSLGYPARNARAPCYIVTCWVSRCTVIFPTISHKQHDFGEKVTRHEMCILIFSTKFVWNISHSKKTSARYYHKYTYIGLHVKYPLFVSDFNETWIFSTYIQQWSISNFMKIRTVEAELLPADGQTDMTNLIGPFRNFGERS